MADYQARLPRHWHERDRLKDKSRDAGFEVQCLLVGRVATAEAACELTADRARRAIGRPLKRRWWGTKLRCS